MFKRGQWTTFGEAFDEEIHALYGDESNEIFASGWFRHAGDTELNGLARWDGTEWRPMAPLPVPVDLDAVRAFARDANGRLIAVGVDSTGVGFVVRWNDPGWTVLATIEGAISSVVLAADGTLVVGGHFDTAGLRHVAQLVGSALVAMGGGFQARPRALVVHQGQVVALDNTFSLVSGSTSQARRWNGSTWEAMDAGFTGERNSARYLGVDQDGRLYSAGNFRWAGLAEAHGLSRWGGRQWEPVPGLSGELGRLGEYLGAAPEFWSPGSPVLAVAPTGTLYLGLASELVYAGGTIASNFMVWSPDGPAAEAGQPGLPAARYSVYPNPTTGLVRIFGGPTPIRVSVFDALGRRFGVIELEPGDSEIALQLPVRARGVYFLVLDLGDRRQTLPVVVR